MNPLSDFKSEIKVFFIVALVGVVLAVAGIFLLQAGLGPSSPAPPQSSDTAGLPRDQAELDFAGWQTYRNDEYGFQIRHPRDWIPEAKTEAIAGFSCFSLEFLPESQVADDQVFGIYVNCPGRGLGQRESREYIIDGYKASGYIFEYPEFGYKDILVVLLQTDNDYNFASNKIGGQHDEELFDQILATFRFTP